MGTQAESDVAEPATRETEQGGVDRRGALRGVAVAGVLGVSGAALAACASNSSSNAGSSNGGGSTTTTTTAQGGATSSGSGTSGELTTTADVPVGSGIINAQAQVVVTQPTAGDYKGFSAICTHAGCTVNQISNGIIQCPCHGSEYSIKDGSVVRGPAPQALAPVSIDVKGTGIFKA